MIEYINQILNLSINSFIVLGIGFLIYFYSKIKLLDSKIENKHREFEEKRDKQRERPVTQLSIDGQIKNLEREKEELLAPLERERKRILSKIPFIK